MYTTKRVEISHRKDRKSLTSIEMLSESNDEKIAEL